MKDSLLTILRNKDTPLPKFRTATHKLGLILASEVSLQIKQKPLPIETTLAKTTGSTLDQEITLVPILRSGVALLIPFLYIFDEATVGFLGMRRDEKTALPHHYYENIPPLNQNSFIILLDPMIATGGSSKEAIKKLLEKNAQESNILLVALVAAQEGLSAIKKSFPKVKTHVVAVDKTLSPEKFIVPGLGDFGDRFFGT